MPFRGCRPEGPKCGKEAYLGYYGWHQGYFELPALSPLSPPVATPGKVSTAAAAKIMCNISFSFTLMQFFNKLIFKKRVVKNSHYISLYLCIIIFCFFSLCSLLLWQKPILYSNISIIILMIIVNNLVIFTLC